jgi:hypothetical protein
VAVSDKSGKEGRDHRGLIDRRLVASLEVAEQPSRRDARMPARIFTRDQNRELERVGQVERR